jgi:hypothetical protein
VEIEPNKENDNLRMIMIKEKKGEIRNLFRKYTTTETNKQASLRLGLEIHNYKRAIQIIFSA